MHVHASLFSSAIVLITAVLLGCDRPPPLAPDVPTDFRISHIVFDVDDFSQDPQELKTRVPRLFAPGSEPSAEKLQRYSAYHYEAKEPVISGDSATINVTIKDAKSGESRGEFKWSATNTKNGWKLTDAPLPEK
jgi:hypothetical protein